MDQQVTAGLLCAARRLLKSAVHIEQQLARTLHMCDRIGQPLCRAVAATLTKLIQDVAAMPLILSETISDPQALRCVLIVLHHVLVDLRPDEIKTAARLQAAQEAAHQLCRRQHLPLGVGVLAALLVQEIATAFRQLDRVLQPPYVRKERNSTILRRRVSLFFRRVRADLFALAFASLKLSVCMRAAAEGCFALRHGDKQLLRGLLQQVQAKARVMAALNDVHRQSLLTAVQMAAPRRRS